MIEVIPPGSSAVVTERRWDNDYRYQNHDVEVVGAVKDAQASIERANGLHYADTVKTIKDAEAQLDRAAGDRFIQTMQDIKDAEARLDRSSADRFIKIAEDIKQAELATEKAKAKVVEQLKEESCNTRDLVSAGFKDVELELCEGVDKVKDSVQEARRELMYNQMSSFKETLLEFKNTQNLAYQLAAAADKTACANQTQTLLQFKEQAMLSERLACEASKQLAECCCEIKELVRNENSVTRALVNSIERDALRDRLSRAELQLALTPLTPRTAGGTPAIPIIPGT